MIIIGIVLLVAGIVCGVLLWLSRRKHKAMLSAETLTVAELTALRDAAVQAAGPGSFRYRCEVVGAALPHHSGPLTAEMSGTACVWHRHTVTHKYWETRTDSKGNSRRQNRQRVVSSHSSETPFALQDTTGTVTIDPRGTNLDRAEKVFDRFDRAGNLAFQASIQIGGLNLTGGDRTIGYQYEEWAVRPSSNLYVLGEVTDQGGQLVVSKPGDGPYIISTRSEEELRKSERTKQTWFTAVAAVATAAGVVLLVLGLLS